jgi:hypothetical protein
MKTSISFMLEINTHYTSKFLSHVEDYDHLPILFKILIVDVAWWEIWKFKTKYVFNISLEDHMVNFLDI